MMVPMVAPVVLPVMVTTVLMLVPVVVDHGKQLTKGGHQGHPGRAKVGGSKWPWGYLGSAEFGRGDRSDGGRVHPSASPGHGSRLIIPGSVEVDELFLHICKIQAGGLPD